MLAEPRLKTLFEKAYDQDEWYDILRQNFGVTNLRSKPLDITNRIASNDYKAKAYEIGQFETADQYLIGLYQVLVPHKAQLYRNRRALRDLLSNIYKTDVDGALVVFVQDSKWRFTYVSEVTVKDTDTSERTEKKTDPKRYTYLFGEAEKAKTAAERFSKLKREEGKPPTLDALQEAFNVEKMSKAFFNRYREHYGFFTSYLTGENENGKETGKAHPLLKSTFNGDKKVARDFIKKMMGRIVFLYFLEKKGWLGVPVDKNWGNGDVNFLSNLFAGSNDKKAFYSNELAPLFFGALNKLRKDDIFKLSDGSRVKIPYLNGGLFEEDEWTTQSLVFRAADFESLFDFFDQYNFTVYEDSPEEHTVAVDPEMLGHIFENLLEDNKEKGTYYTPKEIVHYMCQESLIEYLHTKLNPATVDSFQEIGNVQTDLFGYNAKKGQLALEHQYSTIKEVVSRNTVERFIKQGETGDLLEQEEALLTALYTVKVCDPAIGSGAFPMGILLEIFHAVETLFEASFAVTKKVWKLKSSEWPANRAAVKTAIIQNSIYGVDIEQGAVDIARLRFWLSLVVDEDVPQPLPNLDYKIVVGDSLISKFSNVVVDIDWGINSSKAVQINRDIIAEQEKKLYALKHKQHLYFVSQHSEKQKLKKEILNLKIDVLVNQLELSRIQYSQNNSLSNSAFPTPRELKKNLEIKEQAAVYQTAIQNLRAVKKSGEGKLSFFDWKLDFPEIVDSKQSKDKGFDIVIANPPYVQLQKLKEYADELKSCGYDTYVRTGDIYALFYEMSFKLLKAGGISTFITSNQWMRAAYGEALRKYFTTDVNPVMLIDFAGFKVFDSAIVNTNILISQKKSFQNQVKTVVLGKGFSLNNMSDYFRQNSSVATTFSSQSWTVLSSIEQSIKTKVEQMGKPLKDWDVSINYGIKTGYNEAFIIDALTREALIEKSPKAAEIIRPILRGRDIEKYKANWEELYLIASHNGYTDTEKKQVKPISVNHYPSVKKHLDLYWNEIRSRMDKGVTPYNLRSCIYMEDFSRPKIIYPNMTKFLPFFYDTKGYYTNQKCFIITGKNIAFLTAFFNSSLFKFCFRDNFPKLQGETRELSKVFFDKIPVIEVAVEVSEQFEKKILEIQELNNLGKYSTEIQKEVDAQIFDLYSLNSEERKRIGFIEIV